MLTKVARASTLLFVAIEIYDSHVSLLLLLAVSQKSFANENAAITEKLHPWFHKKGLPM
jgi:hypothetical protein